MHTDSSHSSTAVQVRGAGPRHVLGPQGDQLAGRRRDFRGTAAVFCRAALLVLSLFLSGFVVT